MNQFLSLIASVYIRCIWTSLIPDGFCLHMVRLPSLNSTVIVTCDYVGSVTTLRASWYSLPLTILLFRLVTLCLINSANESPSRLAIHFCYTDSSQLSLISDNSTLNWLSMTVQSYSWLTLSMKVQFCSWLTLSMQVHFNAYTTAFHTVSNLRQF